jgi:hypothetical protein
VSKQPKINETKKLPIYFQAIRNASNFESGLMYLPTAIPFALAVLVAGPVTTLIGYYTPVMVFGSILMAIATGLYIPPSPRPPHPRNEFHIKSCMASVLV